MSKRNKKNIAFFCGVVSFSKPTKRRKRKQPVKVIDIPEVFPRVREVSPLEQLSQAVNTFIKTNRQPYPVALTDALKWCKTGQLFKPLSRAEVTTMIQSERTREFFPTFVNMLKYHGNNGYLVGHFEPNGEVHLIHESFLIPDPSAKI